MMLCLFLLVSGGVAAPDVVMLDPPGDAVMRRVTPPTGGILETTNDKLPDILSCRIGNWQPDQPPYDLFAGQWLPGAGFLRIEVTFLGRVNPPGEAGRELFSYGPSPVLGYIDIDVDIDADTGGELGTPGDTYLGNIARFGGRPTNPIYARRAARDGRVFDCDPDLLLPVERSGEEFHIALNDSRVLGIEKSNPKHSAFLPGDRWILFGKFFHRAHGYEPFSFACCEGESGSYEPDVQLEFRHDATLDVTTVSLVYPLTNDASAAMLGSPYVELLDGDASNQNSIHEALDDLQFGVLHAPQSWMSDPEYPIIARWGSKNPTLFLDAASWRANLLVGTCTSPGSGLCGWTDVLPNVVPGDFNGDGQVGCQDVAMFDAYLAANDGSAFDGDAQVNGSIVLVDFGHNFSLYDVNYDGAVDATDRVYVQLSLTTRPDFDRDGDVDMDDFGVLQACIGGDANSEPCRCADLDRSGRIDAADIALFRPCAQGAGVVVSPNVGCTP